MNCNKKIFKIVVILLYNKTPLLLLGCSLPQTDYYGGDLWNDRVDTLKECEKSCLEASECKKWSFLNNSTFGRCYLKKTSDEWMTTKLTRDRYALTGRRDSGMDKCGSNGRIKMIKGKLS